MRIIPILLAVLLGPSTSLAQGPEDEKIGAWRLICGDGDRGCVARTSVTAQDDKGGVTVDLFLSAGPGGVGTLSLVIDVPVRVSAGAGIARSPRFIYAPAWSADFTTCGGQDGCQASGFLDETVLSGATDPTAVFVSAKGETIAVPVNLDGLEEVNRVLMERLNAP